MPHRARILEALAELAVEHGERPGLASGAMVAAEHIRHGEIDLAIAALLRARNPAMSRIAWTIETELAGYPSGDGANVG